MNDHIDEAIARAGAGEQLTMVEVPVTIGTTGRPAILACPLDITDAERMELAAWLLTGLRKHLDANAAPPAPRLVIASRLP